MESEKGVKKAKRLVNILFAIPVVIVGAFVVGLLYLESLSPAMLFINNTDSLINNYLFGAGSPGIHLNIDPEKSQLVDMPSWWGNADFPKNENGERVKPRWNFVVYKIYYLSDFPESW